MEKEVIIRKKRRPYFRRTDTALVRWINKQFENKSPSQKENFERKVVASVVFVAKPVEAFIEKIISDNPRFIDTRVESFSQDSDRKITTQEFKLEKFRTIEPGYEDKDSYGRLRGNKGVTRIGRFLRAVNLDELPQLQQVLDGQMRLFGPRAMGQDWQSLRQSRQFEAPLRDADGNLTDQKRQIDEFEKVIPIYNPKPGVFSLHAAIDHFRKDIERSFHFILFEGGHNTPAFKAYILYRTFNPVERMKKRQRRKKIEERKAQQANNLS